MTAGAPRKFVDPTSREMAEDLARRSGLSLNEWVSRLMADGPEDATSQDYFDETPPASYVRQPAGRFETVGHPADEVGRVTSAIERLSDRIQTAENRQALAIAGIERSVREVIDRLDGAEREQMQVAARFEGAIQDVRTEAAQVVERLRRVEDEAAGPRSVEALRALEGAIGKVAGHVYDADKRARDTFSEMRARFDGLSASEEATTAAIEDLRGACGALDQRLSLTEASADEGVQAAAANLHERVEETRAELGRQLAEVADARFDRVEQALVRMTDHVRAAEQRSAGAVEKMGREVLEIAQTLNRRVQGVERSNSENAGRISAEVSRIAGAVEDRLNRADSIHAQALEKLGGEIARITERLADRIANAERRSAQAIDDVGEQVSRVSERLSQRSDRTATELAERIRQSEERTGRLLEEARAKIDERLAETHKRLAETAAKQAQAEAADESLFGDAPFPGFEDKETRRDPFVEAEATGAGPPLQPSVPLDPPAAPPPLAEAPAIQSAIAPASLAPTSLAQSALVQNSVVHGPTFDDEDFAAVASFDSSAPEATLSAAPAFEPRPEATFEPIVAPQVSQAAEPIAPAPAAPMLHEPSPPLPPLSAPSTVLDFDDVELEPNVGFDVDDELVGHAADPSPQPTDRFDAPPASFAAAPQLEVAPPEPEARADAVPAFEPPTDAASPLTTRDVIERARAAARAANERGGGQRSSKSDETILQSMSFGRARKAAGPNGAMVVASLLAAVGLSAGGYMAFHGKPGAALPKRVADALSVVSGDTAPPAAGPQGSAQLAALAMAPTPIATAPAGPDLSKAFDSAKAMVEADKAGGVIDIRRLADQGFAPAQFYLSQLYQDGKAGLKKDAATGHGWLEKAAEGGDRTAMYNLALDEHEGIGGPKNLPAAAEWFRRAAELGLIDSQYNLAALYEHGSGVAANPAEAYKWYLIAARAGDSESRAGAERVRAGLSADARSVAERAAADFQPSPPPAATAPAVTPVVAQSSSADLATAQRALNQLGYYQGPTDGVSSPALHMALAAYQRDQSLPVTGTPDAATIGKLSAYTR